MGGRRPSFGTVFALVLALSVVGSSGTVAVDPPAEETIPPEELTFGGDVSVNLVLVPTVVRSRKGYVRDLRKREFRLFVDSREVPLELFERGATAPLSLVWLQDLSGSMAHLGKLDASRVALSFFLGRQRAGDEYALATFAGGQTRVEVPFTDAVDVIGESMEVWEGWGTTALYDAVSWLPEISLDADRFKRAAVVVTDGVDNASAVSPDEARDIVSRAELPVYVLGLAGYATSRDDETFRYADLLELLADGTGGRYYSVTNADDVRRACAAILAELRHQYLLGFSALGDGTEEYHPIRVDVKRRRSRVLHRRGYRGGDPVALDPSTD